MNFTIQKNKNNERLLALIHICTVLSTINESDIYNRIICAIMQLTIKSV